MATKPQLMGEGFNSIAGMSKSQLYDLMSQMKLLIDQNRQQAKQILIDNPMLTRALFQAQIMLGMVQPTQPANIQKVLSQAQSTQVGQQSNIHSSQSLLVQPGHWGQTSLSQPSTSVMHQHPPQAAISMSSAASIPALNFQSQTMPSIPPHSVQHTKGPVNAHLPPISAPQSSHIHDTHLPPPPGPPHFSILQPQMPSISSQAQPSLQIPGVFNQPMQPPLPQQPRPPSIQQFPPQIHSQLPHNLGFQLTSAPQQHLSQHMFHSGSNLTSFPHGQPPLPSQPPPQHFYQAGPHMGLEYNNQVGTSMQAGRDHWVHGLPEGAGGGPHLPGLPSLGTGQMVPGLPRPPPLTPEMENALLQQVMSLTHEQINLLPPEQRQQVFQLQKMLR